MKKEDSGKTQYKKIKNTKQGIRHQMRGVKERKYEAYTYYDEYLKDEGNEVDGVLGRVLVGVDEAGEKRILGASQEVVDILGIRKISYNLNSSCKERAL